MTCQASRTSWRNLQEAQEHAVMVAFADDHGTDAFASCCLMPESGLMFGINDDAELVKRCADALNYEILEL